MPTVRPQSDQGQRILAAIVLTDAVGFSARMSMDEESTLALIQADLKLIESLCQQFEGEVIKSMGDGMLMYFVSAVQAVNCSLEIQRHLKQHHEAQAIANPLLHRIGVHLGDVFLKDSDVMGNGVNIAARLQSEAHPGGICISQIAYDVVKSRLTLNAIYAGPLKLKNIKEPQPAYHVQPFDDPASSLQPPDASGQAAAGAFQGEAQLAFSAEASAHRDRLHAGTRVGGRYEVQRVLGQGGFGRSYLVKDTQRFGELCVLKEFFPASNSSSRSLQKALALFKREAKTLYQINHPQIPTFMACFTQGKRLFIVQEYINGVTYAQLLKQRKREGRCFSVEEVIRWLIHLLQVLDYLHGLNVVHRDISPDNVMYSSDRNLPVLIDFGLVTDTMGGLLAEGDDSGAESDESGGDSPSKSPTIVGKFGYSPPEQMQLGQCSPCSDIYALGVTAIVLLTGKYPRELTDRDSLEWNWQRYISCPQRLAQLLNKMTQQRPQDRFQSAQEVLRIAVTLIANPSSPLPQRSLSPLDLSFDPTVAPPFGDPIQDEPPPVPDPAFVAQCREELTRSVGPMASVLIEDVLEQHPEASPQELVMLLAAQLSDGSQAEAFTSRVYAKSTLLETSLGSISQQSSAPAETSPSQSQISAQFLEQCHQALSQLIGPMADFLIEETLADYPELDPQSLVRQLASEIPDARKALEFQKRLW